MTASRTVRLAAVWLALLAPCGAYAAATPDEARGSGLDVNLELDGGSAYLKQNLSLKFTFVNRLEPDVTIEAEAFGPDAFTIKDKKGVVVPLGAAASAATEPLVVAGYGSTEHRVNLSAWYPRLTAKETTWEIAWHHPPFETPPLKVRIIPPHDPAKDRFVVVETDLGSMKWELLPELAPQHVRRFVDLVRQGYYDGLTFFRYVQGLQAEGGAPADERADLWGRLVPPEVGRNFVPGPGMVGAARPQGSTASSMTSESVFFVIVGGADFMQGSQTFFARIVKGYEVMAMMSQRENRGATGDERAYRLVTPVIIQKMSIRRR